jgi:hypothetical protein
LKADKSEIRSMIIEHDVLGQLLFKEKKGLRGGRALNKLARKCESVIDRTSIKES